MGQIKNIKLHIVTDIKSRRKSIKECKWTFMEDLSESPPLPSFIILSASAEGSPETGHSSREHSDSPTPTASFLVIPKSGERRASEPPVYLEDEEDRRSQTPPTPGGRKYSQQRRNSCPNPRKHLKIPKIDRRGWCVADEQSLQNFYLDKYEVARFFARIINKIVGEPEFNPDHFQAYNLHLCEAYCLLWQNPKTGRVSGRKVGLPLKIGNFSAVFIDLYVSRRLDIFTSKRQTEPCFQIVDHRATETTLDYIIFNTMRKSASRGNLRECLLMSSLARAEQADCVNSTLDSLIAKGVLEERTTGIFGRRKIFPTLDPAPENTLRTRIKDVAMKKKDVESDSFVDTLLILARESDKIFSSSAPILGKYFTEGEYLTAMQNIDEMFKKYSQV